METKKLLKLSLITALLGTFLITILSEKIEPETINIETINEKRLEEWVKIEGIVTQHRIINNLNIITINDETAAINCIYFSNEKQEKLEKQRVEIIGKVIDYKGDIEIEIIKLVKKER